MANSSGADSSTGVTLTDWLHVQQSIDKILTTRIGSRVMRRNFGSDVPDLIDAKMTTRNILAVYSAAASAIQRWEPRFRMTGGRIDGAGFMVTENGRTAQAGQNGRVSLSLHGTYFPRGHLGDYSIAEDRDVKVVLS